MSNIQVIAPPALPIKINVDGTEYVVFYNDSTGRLERFLFSDLESINNKAVDFSVVNDIKYPTTKAVNDQKGIVNGIASLDSNGKLSPLQIPDIAITDVIVATETNISDFATNSGNYTFQQGDVIIITDGGNVKHYLFKGGLKTDVNEYSLINVTEIPISQVVGLQTALDGKVLKSGDTMSGALKIYPNTIVNELLILRGMDAIADIIMLDTTGSGRLRMVNGSFSFFTGGSSGSESASGATETVVFSSSSATFQTPVIINRTIAEIDSGSQKGGTTKEWVESKISGGVLDYDVSDRVTSIAGSFEDVYTHTILSNRLKVGDVINIRVSGQDAGGSGTRGVNVKLNSSSLNVTNPFFSTSTSDFIVNIEVIITSATTYTYNSSVEMNQIATAGNNARRVQSVGVSGVFNIASDNDIDIALNNPNNGDLTIKTSTIKI